MPNPEKVKAVKDLQPPQTLKQLRSTLEILAYYRKFIPNFSKIAAPLYGQTKKHVQNKRDKTGKIELTEASAEAFEALKEAITKEPIVLHYPYWEQPFEIHTDASSKAVAAILCQRIDGKEKVIMCRKKVSDLRARISSSSMGSRTFRNIRNTKTKFVTDCAALQW